MSSSNFASFSPYTPPPDEQHDRDGLINPYSGHTSYQSGAVPTFSSSYTNVPAASTALDPQNEWETTSGYRVDLLAGCAYLLGPLSALLLLILETRNDFVRFHAYQSALVTTPLLVFRILASLTQLATWFRSFLTLILILVQTYLAARAYLDASRLGLPRFTAPLVGVYAERWVEAE